ncbi:hypothetical protein VaNZ11_016051 [Volvox africanus]|uniref:Dihydrolipoamide acetyltransferase component of pyruvate dehydrogenase complex n=1 Tax=Volvox africanus TaxID=51714 RepID=A0ABQ5SLT4_9CHLO|nr:hypothetical protein VaNZ11_016051 [Volvox africanus]
MNSGIGPLFLLRSLSNINRLSQLYYALPLRGHVKRGLSPAGVPEVPILVRLFAKLVSFPLAQTGEGISECELVSWAVKPGDLVGPFDKLCDVQSDKAAIEITSRYGGKVLALHHAVGAMVKVGAPLLDIEVADDVQVAAEHLAAVSVNTALSTAAHSGDDGGSSSSAAPQTVAFTAAKVAVQGIAEAAPTVVATAAPPPPTTGRSALAAPAAAAAVPVTQSSVAEASLPSQTAPAFGSGSGSGSGRFRVQASPAVRMFARENGVDLGLVGGTGPGGRITRADVLQHMEQQLLGGRRPENTTVPAGRPRAAEEEDDDGSVVLQASDFLGAPGMAVQGAAGASAAGGGGGATATGQRLSRARVGVDELLAQYKRLVTSAAASPPQRGVAAVGGGAGEARSHVVPLRGYRRAMVTSMTAAASVPVFHFHDEVAMDRLLAVREALRGDVALRTTGLKLTVLPMVVKALSAALNQHPHINASLAPGGTELLLHPHHNIGVAMATPNGLVVPNIKQVERKSIAQVAAELHLLQQLAAAGRLPPESLTGGTITVSNIGTIGGTYATPIVNPPEVAIVALGRMQLVPRYPSGPGVLSTPGGHRVGAPLLPQAVATTMTAAGGSGGVGASARWALEGQVGGGPAALIPVPVTVMPVSWGADHRVVDGAALATFSNTWTEFLEQPDKLLLHLA